MPPPGTVPCRGPSQRDFVKFVTAGINRSNTAARAVLEQPCSTGVRTDTVRPKREPTGRTDLSDRSRLVLCNRSQELIGQACPTRRQVLRSDSACPTTGRTRLFEHRSNCRVRPVNAGTNLKKHSTKESARPFPNRERLEAMPLNQHSKELASAEAANERERARDLAHEILTGDEDDLGDAF
ncbi:hypothetical protein PCASD_03406 [Puccinia coronata f. sp. avenae]|uniref:Uncharacterized protein n=1 Tax=Puccinia coronata f. sp. avenae TaxID=200324 RepID=A0A2N5VF22_9BASI|nr:hypothetical protein PCASD_03406 [Puccinia coronata f. sp. avenae]